MTSFFKPSAVLAVISLAVSVAPSGQAQEKKAPAAPGQFHPKVDQAKVDAAVRKGVEYIKGRTESFGDSGSREWSGELVLWTLLHAGVPESDLVFRKLLDEMLRADLRFTYRVSLQAMVLEELERVKHQPRIWQCAQFLVDNQDAKGQWGYGEPTTYVKIPPGVPSPRKDVATSGKSAPKVRDFGAPGARREKPKIVQKLSVVKQRDGTCYDNSNTQYAALGLRACFDSGIVFEEKVITLAQDWWRKSQIEDPSKGKDGYPARGWGYARGGALGGEAYGSMTAGAVGGLCIYAHMLGRPWKNDPAIQAGLNWLGGNFTVTRNPGPVDNRSGLPGTWYFYYLYALERAGVLYVTDRFGSHDWYAEGANQLLKDQKADGAWVSKDDGEPVWDTCWAILFLKRATRPLDVASVDPFHRK